MSVRIRRTTRRAAVLPPRARGHQTDSTWKTGTPAGRDTSGLFYQNPGSSCLAADRIRDPVEAQTGDIDTPGVVPATAPGFWKLERQQFFK